MPDAKRFLVSVPFALHVWIEAESSDSITEDMVEGALMEEHGKYATVDIRNGGGEWDVIDEEPGALTPTTTDT